MGGIRKSVRVINRLLNFTRKRPSAYVGLSQAHSAAARIKPGLKRAFLFTMTTALLAPAFAVFFSGFSPVSAYTASDIATNAETHADGSPGGECKDFASR